MKRIGGIAFALGVGLAMLAGLVSTANSGVLLLLVLLGIVVGLLNIREAETQPYLLAAVALVVAGTVGFKPIDELVKGLGSRLDSIVNYISAFVAPAAIIVAVKAVWGLARKA